MLCTLGWWLFPFSVLHWFVSCFFAPSLLLGTGPWYFQANSDGDLWRRPASAMASCPILTFSSTWQSLTRWNVSALNSTLAQLGRSCLVTVESRKSWKAYSLVLQADQARGCCRFQPTWMQCERLCLCLTLTNHWTYKERWEHRKSIPLQLGYILLTRQTSRSRKISCRRCYFPTLVILIPSLFVRQRIWFLWTQYDPIVISEAFVEFWVWLASSFLRNGHQWSITEFGCHTPLRMPWRTFPSAGSWDHRTGRADGFGKIMEHP